MDTYRPRGARPGIPREFFCWHIFNAFVLPCSSYPTGYAHPFGYPCNFDSFTMRDWRTSSRGRPHGIMNVQSVIVFRIYILRFHLLLLSFFLFFWNHYRTESKRCSSFCKFCKLQKWTRKGYSGEFEMNFAFQSSTIPIRILPWRIVVESKRHKRSREAYKRLKFIRRLWNPSLMN